MNGTTQQAMPEITATELKQRLDNGDDIQIVDVREDNEVAIAKLPNTIHIPLGQIVNRMSEIDPARETVVHCKMGGPTARLSFHQGDSRYKCRRIPSGAHRSLCVASTGWSLHRSPPGSR